MNPLHNSLPYHSTHIQTDGNSASTAQQVMGSNHFLGNLAQGQPQIGVNNNPQIAIPFNSSNTHMGNANLGLLPSRPISVNSSCFVNVPNQAFPLQSAMHPLGQFHNGFSPQNLNLNSIGMNQVNSSQPSVGQFFAHNSMNLAPYSNPSASLLNGQLLPFQNMSQFVQMQMPNYTQVFPGNIPLLQNQVALGMHPQNPNFFVKQQFDLAHFNGPVQHGNQEQQKLIPDVNASNQSSNHGQHLQGNSYSQSPISTVQPQQTQKFLSPAFAKSQGNPGNNSGASNVSSKWKASQNKNFRGHKKMEGSQMGVKSLSHQKQNAKGRFGFRGEHWGKGNNNGGETKSGLANSSNRTHVEKTKPLSLNYTEQEIQQWRENRKKNYPSKLNMDKKPTESQTLPEVTDRDAKLRRQQLKEILAKQAELGCEVAEIPSSYLSDSEKQGIGREDDERKWGKKGKFQNKFKKRGKPHQNNKFIKKQMDGDHDSSNVNNENNRFTKKQRFVDNDDSSTRPALNKRKPTLLQKLMTADIRRDKSHLLQVFKFMVVNSFFTEWPEKSLKFPSVIVKETIGEGEVVEEKASLHDKAIFEGGEKAVNARYIDRNSDSNDTGKDDEIDAQHKGRRPDEEEGEIID